MAKQKKEKKAGSRSKPETTGALVKTTTGEPVVMDNEDKDILAGISQDLDNGDIGQFYHIRGCVALVLLKERCPYGLYESTIAEAMPHRKSRTLRKYFSEGRRFLAANNMKAAVAYAQLMSFDPVQALSQTKEGRLLIVGGGGGEVNTPDDYESQADDDSQADDGFQVDDNDSQTDDDSLMDDVPQAVAALVKKINDKVEEKTNPKAGNKEKPKLTKAQKRDAATADLTLAISKVNVALNSDWTLIDTETLDTIAASLTVAAATIKEEIKKRG